MKSPVTQVDLKGGTPMVKDVVCGMGVEEDALDTFSRKYQGRVYYFCCAECMLSFSREPLFYLEGTAENREMARDLVCGMKVDGTNPPFIAQYEGRTYYFCSKSCQYAFERTPVKFVRNERRLERLKNP